MPKRFCARSKVVMVRKEYKDVISVDTNSGYYMHYHTPKSKGGRRISFDYAWNKMQRLYAWLLAADVITDEVDFRKHYGTVKGFKRFLDITDEVDFYCELHGIECEAMLCRELIGLEGRKVVVHYASGRQAVGYVKQWGKYIKTHIIVRNMGMDKGMLCKDGDVVEVEILDSV